WRSSRERLGREYIEIIAFKSSEASLRIEDGGLRMAEIEPRSSILDPPSSTQSLRTRIKRIHHQALVMSGRAQILIERVREHAVRHHRVAVVRARTGPDHVRVVGRLKIAVAGHRLCFMNSGARRHAAVDAP